MARFLDSKDPKDPKYPKYPNFKDKGKILFEVKGGKLYLELKKYEEDQHDKDVFKPDKYIENIIDLKDFININHNGEITKIREIIDKLKNPQNVSVDLINGEETYFKGIIYYFREIDGKSIKVFGKCLNNSTFNDKNSSPTIQDSINYDNIEDSVKKIIKDIKKQITDDCNKIEILREHSEQDIEDFDGFLKKANERLAAEKAKKEVEEKAKKEAEEKTARLEAERVAEEEKAKKEAERLAAARLEEEKEKARLVAAEATRLAAEEKTRLEAEEKARVAAEQAKKEAEKAIKEAEEKAIKEEAEKAEKEAAEQAKKEAAEQAKKEAERVAAELTAKLKAEKAKNEKIKLGGNKKVFEFLKSLNGTGENITEYKGNENNQLLLKYDDSYDYVNYLDCINKIKKIDDLIEICKDLTRQNPNQYSEDYNNNCIKKIDELKKEYEERKLLEKGFDKRDINSIKNFINESKNLPLLKRLRGLLNDKIDSIVSNKKDKTNLTVTKDGTNPKNKYLNLTQIMKNIVSDDKKKGKFLGLLKEASEKEFPEKKNLEYSNQKEKIKLKIEPKEESKEESKITDPMQKYLNLTTKEFYNSVKNLKKNDEKEQTKEEAKEQTKEQTKEEAEEFIDSILFFDIFDILDLSDIGIELLELPESPNISPRSESSSSSSQETKVDKFSNNNNTSNASVSTQNYNANNSNNTLKSNLFVQTDNSVSNDSPITSPPSGQVLALGSKSSQDTSQYQYSPQYSPVISASNSQQNSASNSSANQEEYVYKPNLPHQEKNGGKKKKTIRKQKNKNKKSIKNRTKK